MWGIETTGAETVDGVCGDGVSRGVLGPAVVEVQALPGCDAFANMFFHEAMGLEPFDIALGLPLRRIVLAEVTDVFDMFGAALAKKRRPNGLPSQRGRQRHITRQTMGRCSALKLPNVSPCEAGHV